MELSTKEILIVKLAVEKVKKKWYYFFEKKDGGSGTLVIKIVKQPRVAEA